MIFPIALLSLTGHTDASPTLVEVVNSGLAIVGAKYVPPPTSEAEQDENESGTRQSTCRDCSAKVNATHQKPEFHLRRFFQGRFLWDLFTTTTTISPLPCCPGTSGCAKCGVEKTRRVIGGVETAAGVYPWIAALSYNGNLGGCSATLVSSNWAVTAAHCVFSNVLGVPTSLVLGGFPSFHTYGQPESRK